MKIHPLQNFILVKRSESERTGSAEIYIAGSATGNYDFGTVIAASSGTQLKNGNLRPLEVRTGDKIMFGKSIGQPVKVDEAELLIMREDDIAAVIEA